MPRRAAEIGSGTGAAAACVRVNAPELSDRFVSLTEKVKVGLFTEKLPKPSAPRLVAARVKVTGGLALPDPFAALVAKSCCVSTPEMVRSNAPNVVKLPVFVLDPPTGEDPETTTTPAPFVQ